MIFVENGELHLAERHHLRANRLNDVVYGILGTKLGGVVHGGREDELT